LISWNNMSAGRLDIIQFFCWNGLQARVSQTLRLFRHDEMMPNLVWRTRCCSLFSSQERWFIQQATVRRCKIR